MGRKEKLQTKLRHATKTFPWSDLETLMSQLGYKKFERQGSRVVFMHIESGFTLHIHKPHPENYIKGGALKDVKERLETRGDL